MKEKFPKFLKKSPSVLGLKPFDLALLIAGLFLSQFLGAKAIWGLFFTLVIIAFHKFFSHWIDFEGVLLSPTKRQSLEWIDERRRFL